MENSNYAESGDSSPRSRDVDSENPSYSWDEQQPPTNYRVKFMCSYGGKIQPRPHDNQLTYFGGDTKILAVDRNIKFSDFVNKLSSFCDSNVYKYQLPGEDLDALISLTNEEDLEHMMLEYDRVHRISPKPPRLRLFIFQQRSRNQTPKSYDSNDSNLNLNNLNSKPNQQWLADAVNSVPIHSLESSAVEAPSLFGANAILPPPVVKVLDPEPLSELEVPVEVPGRLEDRIVGESPALSPVEIQRQIHELQKLQIANQEQAMFRKNSDEALARAFHGDYYAQNLPEKTIPAAPSPGTVTNPPTYWQQDYTTGNEHPVYLIPSPAGMYQPSTTAQPVTAPLPAAMYQASMNVQPGTGQVGQVSQGYYAMQRVQHPEVYREQPVYSVGPPQPQIIARPGGGVAGGEAGYAQVAYDNAGRQVYFTAAPGSVIPNT